MAFQKLLAVCAVILLSNQGCQSQQQPACGIAVLNTKIVGGHNAGEGAWPWQIVFKNGDFFFCGGSVITDEWIMTAAHCGPSITAGQTTVHLGVYNLTGYNPTEVVQQISEVICNPNYNSATFDNDICLVRMASPVNFTDYIQPICLAAEGSTFYDGLVTWVTGFGVTNPATGEIATIIQEVAIPIVGNNQCECLDQSIATITGNMMCAGIPAGGLDSCQGDSGGPMVVQNGPAWVQAGVVSFGEGCALPEKPGVYTRVSQYQQWITDTVTGMPPSFVLYTSSGTNYDAYFTCPAGTTPPTITAPTTPPPTTDNSLFGSGENLSHFTHLMALSVSGLFLHLLVGSGRM